MAIRIRYCKIEIIKQEFSWKFGIELQKEFIIQFYTLLIIQYLELYN